MDKKYILFDLDGTLTDSAEGIIKGVQVALNKFGIVENNGDILKTFVGPPLKERFIQVYNFTQEQALEAVREYQRYFVSKGMFENKVYPGITAMLDRLAKKDKKLVVATSKPEVFARRILEYFGLDRYFMFVGGSSLDDTRKQKNEVISYILQNMHINDVSELVMVGDTKYDVVGARYFNMDCIAVLYGYGTEQSIREANPKCVVKSVKELEQLLLH